MPPAIVVENLGKSYRVQHEQVRGGYKTLRESLVSAAARPVNRLRSLFTPHPSPLTPHSEEFWALNDVSFEVQPGEVVGIIGRNGAGKSTLLKILSRITKPTRGRVTVNGRVGSLLEVGTGFHAELTGRENIFMNGSILGMSRREIQRKFDEIVEFAGVERFLDTPVKRYSSGMYVRLAFAVAAHLDLEVMLVDEVLAVGDMQFQRKCLDKMGDVAGGGRTVHLVSHNMAAVESLCSRVLLVDAGSVVHDGDSSAAIQKYIRLTHQMASLPIAERTDRIGDGSARIVGIDVQDLNGSSQLSCPMGEGIRVLLQLHVRRPLPAVCVGLLFETDNAQRVFAVRSATANGHQCLRSGITVVSCEISPLHLIPGRYSIHAVVRSEQEVHDRVNQATRIDITPADVFGTGRLPLPFDGPCFAHSNWSFGPAARGVRLMNCGE
jgi:lipopolysaccharide transport system ATP-binding protein